MQLVIYTASLSKYADPLLDILDPNHVRITVFMTCIREGVDFCVCFFHTQNCSESVRGYSEKIAFFMKVRKPYYGHKLF